MVSLDSVGQTAVNVVVIILCSLFGILLSVGLGVWVKRLFRFNQFRVVIWEKDGLGNVVQRVDKAGIFVDPATRNKRFFVKRANVGLEPDNIPYVQSGKRRTVYLVRTGLMNYRFIRPKISDDFTVFTVGEEDVNWAVNAYERQKVVFSSKKWLQYLPYISLAIVAFAIMIVLIYLFKQFDVFRDVANAGVTMSENMRYACASNGTMVIT